MNAMQFGNRGFGGPPQPQRQGGRRGNRGGGGPPGGFRNTSRFEHNQNQRNQNEGQRPDEFPQSKPQQQQQATKPPQPQQAAKTPQQTKPVQQQPAQQKPPQQTPGPQKQESQAQPSPQQQSKPAQITPSKQETPKPQDKVDIATPEQKTPQGSQPNQQSQQSKNVNGAFGGNKQGGWQGGPGNKQRENSFAQGGDGNYGQGGGKFGQGGQGMNQGGVKFGQGGQGGLGGQGGPGGLGGQGGLGSQGGPDGQDGPGGQSGPGMNQGGGKFGQGGRFGQGGKFGQGGPGGPGGPRGPGGLGVQGGPDGQGGPEGQDGPGGQGGPGKFGQGGRFGQGGKFGQGGQGGSGGPGMNQGGGKFGQGHGGGNQGGNRSFGGPGGPGRNQQGQKRGPHDHQGLKPMQREEQMLAHKLKDLMGPLTDLPSIEQSEVKFNGRSRLYIGNLTNDVTEEEISAMFGQFGETAELFLNKEKMFGFIKMDYRVNAERAKRELDGKMHKGKTLRVRFAPHNSAIRVKNLPPFVSNELLYRAFEIFGKIERAYVRVDERGKTLSEGVVEFARKPSALAALRNCTEKCFFLTSSLRPVIVESFEEPDELDGYPEKNLPKKHPEFLRAREVGPRFSELNSFEHEYGTRWKQLHELHKQKEDALKKELSAEEEKLEAQMEFARYEHETEMLREKLRQREQEKELHKRTWEMAERAADERRDSERAVLLRQEEQLAARMRQQDDELRRRQQENTLFVQAQRLNSMLDRQEQGMFDQQQPLEGGFRDQYDRGNFEEQGNRGGWDGPRMDDYPNKRRRY